MKSISNQKSERQYFTDWLRIILFLSAKNLITAPLITGSLLLTALSGLPAICGKPSDILNITIVEFSGSHPVCSFLTTGLLIAFGLSLIVSGWRQCYGKPIRMFLLLLFGCSFLAASVFSGINQSGIIYSSEAILIHRLFAGISIISFGLLTGSFALADSFYRIRNISFMAGVSVFLFLIFQAESQTLAGIWQKLILVSITVWFTALSRYTK